MELVKIENVNGNLVVSSRVVAEALGKEHKRVMQDCREKLEDGVEFVQSSYVNSQNKTQPELLLTKDGFILLCMNYQGYNDFKRAYINKFNEMEKASADPLAMYEGKTKWEIVAMHVQAEIEKDRLALENKQIKEQVVEIKSCLNNLEADTRVNINQAIKRLADLYCKHNKLSGVDREGIHREIYQTIYTGFCKEYDIDFQTIKDKQYVSLKTGKPCKTKQSFIKIIESMGYTGILMDYVCSLKATEIEVGGTKCLN